MDYTKETISCSYIEYMEKWMNYLFYGLKTCDIENVLSQIECDLFLISTDCDLNFCFSYGKIAPTCNKDVSCSLSLVDLSETSLCNRMTLITI